MGLQVELLEKSFALVAPKADKLADLFYGYLFADFPAVVPMFEGLDMSEQKKKLLASIKLTVENLRRPEVLVPVLQQMGSRHVDYGAEEAHYPAVGQTLLKALAEVAGDAWNDDLQNAWTEAYGLISEKMLEGATATVA